MPTMVTIPTMSDNQQRHGTFARKLAGLRKAKGWTQEDLGARIGKVQSRVGKWETGCGVPEPKYLYELVKQLGCSFEYLCLDEVEDPAPAPTDSALSKDEKFLLELARKIGVSEATDRMLGFAGAGKKAKGKGKTGPVGPVSISKRPFKRAD